MKYSFNHAGPYVEIPALDSFLHELRAVCKRYGIGYRLVRDGDYSFLDVVPFEHCDWDMFLDDLSSYDGGVPLLDEAKTRWLAALAESNEAEEARRNEQKKRAEAEDQMRRVRREDDMKRNGVILTDGVYKLVKEENV